MSRFFQKNPIHLLRVLIACSSILSVILARPADAEIAFTPIFVLRPGQACEFRRGTEVKLSEFEKILKTGRSGLYQTAQRLQLKLPGNDLQTQQRLEAESHLIKKYLEPTFPRSFLRNCINSRCCRPEESNYS